MILKLNVSKKLKDQKYIALTPDKKKYEFTLKPNNTIAVNKAASDMRIEDCDDGFTYVVSGEKRVPVEIVEKNQNRYEVLVNGISYKFSIESPISYKRNQFLSKTQTVSKTENINAPMPGKIIDVLVEVNSMVTQGEAIVVLEAMKMQNEILSTVTGKVKSIRVKKDDIVMRDDILIEIEK
jgi:propionyl-CoA carboxylase alpha chain